MTAPTEAEEREAREAGESHARKCWRGGSRDYRSLAVDCREDFTAGYLAALAKSEKRIKELEAAIAKAAKLFPVPGEGER